MFRQFLPFNTTVQPGLLNNNNTTKTQKALPIFDISGGFFVHQAWAQNVQEALQRQRNSLMQST